MNRNEVYNLIDGERAYQNGNELTPNPLTIGEFVLLLNEYEYADKARSQWTGEPKPEVETMGIVRKIAAIAVNAMEQHGAPARS